MPSFYGVVLYSELIGVQYSGTRIGAVMVNGVALVAEVFSRPTVARAQQAPMGRWSCRWRRRWFGGEADMGLTLEWAPGVSMGLDRP